MARDRFDSPAGSALRDHRSTIVSTHLRTALDDPARPAALTFTAGPLTIDLSRMLGDPSTIHLLADLAVELGVPERLHGMATGQQVNGTERRAALHTALRAASTERVVVDGQNVVPEVVATAERVSTYVDAVRSGERLGATGEQFRSAVVMGIGGSDLGPRMVTAATRAHHTGDIDVHFIANVDPAELDAVLPRLDPATTLLVVISKTFTTVETLANAHAALAWLAGALGESALEHHLCAVTTAIEEASDFGVPPAAIFGFRDWVGGRFSLSSAVGIGIELAVGRSGMQALRDGMRAVDQATLHTPPEQNAALLLGMLDVWYTDFLGTSSKAVVPYAQDLALLPAHLQQLQMESNGKSVTADGSPVGWPTSPSVWGAPGTNGQHAFFQMLHQGPAVVPVDFVGVRSISGDRRAELLQSNLLAQAAALALGRTADELRGSGVPPELVPHKVMPGNRPSSLIWLPDLTPHSVGALVALYEHATVVSGFAWGVNPFDQWGVERGKELANGLLPAVSGGEPPPGTDQATLASLDHLLRG